MARVLDLNTVQESLLDITLRDDARTVVHLDIPSEALINEMQNMGPSLKNLEKGDKAAVEAIYDLAARLVSCNLDGFKVTGPELLHKYGMGLVTTLAFFGGYMGAIDALTKEKN